jgi:uncharacterized phiE125 gp8 family phage protein
MDWTGIKIKTAPAVEPVTVQEMREYLSLGGTEDDTLLTGLITAARAALEKMTGRTFITTTYQCIMTDSSIHPSSWRVRQSVRFLYHIC